MIAAIENLQSLDAVTTQAGGAKTVFKILRESSGVDFSQYAQATVLRRLAKRMSDIRVQSLGDYCRTLRKDPAEREHLFETLLVPTTSFFREKAAFAALKRIVFPRLISASAPQRPIRIWVAGCSSGEEAYSIAIALTESIERAESRRLFQIFAPDTNRKAIQQARSGHYPQSGVRAVSTRRLGQFFSFDRGIYRVHDELRDRIVFARQTLGVDPPFGHMDLISCQNVLIYFGAELQKLVIKQFYVALKRGGFLLLGPAESITAPGLFKRVTKSCKLFRKVSGEENHPPGPDSANQF